MAKKLAVTISRDPYSDERAYMGLRIALNAAIQDYEVTVFLLSTGTNIVKKGQDPTEGPNMEEWVNNLLDADVKIISCGNCNKSRGIKKEEYIEGIEWGSMSLYVKTIMESDAQMTF